MNIKIVLVIFLLLYNDYDNLKKKEFILAYGSRWQSRGVTSGHRHGCRNKKLTANILIHKHITQSRKGKWHEHLNSQSSY